MKLTKIEIGVVVAIGLCVVGIVIASNSVAKEKERFMADCTNDKPEYECQAMWAEIHPPAQQVILWAPLNR